MNGWTVGLAVFGAGALAAALTLERALLRARRHPHAPSDQMAWVSTGSLLGVLLIRALTLPPRLALFAWLASFAPTRLEVDPLSLGLLYVAADALYYAKHRWLHSSRLGRRIHAAHHSGRSLSLFVALRLSWVECAIQDLFFLPLVLLGWPPGLTLLVVELNHLSPFFSHTVFVRALGPLDRWLNTPAAHRAHHAAPLERPRNLGATFLVWDRLCGTYAAPLREMPAPSGRELGLWETQLGRTTAPD